MYSRGFQAQRIQIGILTCASRLTFWSFLDLLLVHFYPITSAVSNFRSSWALRKNLYPEAQLMMTLNYEQTSHMSAIKEVMVWNQPSSPCPGGCSSTLGMETMCIVFWCVRWKTSAVGSVPSRGVILIDPVELLYRVMLCFSYYTYSSG